MNSAWNSVIFMKTDKPMTEMSKMAKEWSGDIVNMWSTTGDWDICVMLKDANPEKAEMMAERMKKSNWATHTRTSWWKQLESR